MTFSSVTSNHRRGLLALLTALALAAALSAGLVQATGMASADTGHRHAPPTPVLHTRSQLAFHDQMRKLWEDHVTWTRLAIVTFADGSAGFPATAARLQANQDDIGNAIKPFYGARAGARLSALLHDHIGIAVELLQAAKAGDQQAFQRAHDSWYANADDIADFLAAANPRSWPRAEMRAMMSEHLDQTLAEASHELAGQYTASVADYEEIHHHILEMADVLSNGIIRAFPSRFH